MKTRTVLDASAASRSESDARCPRRVLTGSGPEPTRQAASGRQAPGEEARHAARERARVGDRLALDDARLVQQQPGQLVELEALAGVLRQLGHLARQLVLRVHLEHALAQLL